MAIDIDDAIDTLETAFASGTLEVTFSDGRRVKYQTTTELRKAIDYFNAKKRAAASAGAVNVSQGAFTRG